MSWTQKVTKLRVRFFCFIIIYNAQCMNLRTHAAIAVTSSLDYKIQDGRSARSIVLNRILLSFIP